MRENRVLIGITGVPGSGKTTLTKIFEDLECGAIYSDEIAHRVLEREDVKERIRETFGEDLFDENGRLQRRKLGERVFLNERENEKLLEIVKEPILEEIRDEIRRLTEEGYKIIVVDAPLVFEYGAQEMFDFIIFVITTKDLAKKRFVLNKGYPEDFAEKFIEKSFQSKKKFQKNAQYLVENNLDLQNLKNQALKILNEIKLKKGIY